MTNISEVLGLRIRYYRKKRGISQEHLSELAGLHPTYIGQLERGEKNASIDTLYRISIGLQVPLTQLLEKIDEYPAIQNTNMNHSSTSENIPLQAYEIFTLESKDTQKKLLILLKSALALKS